MCGSHTEIGQQSNPVKTAYQSPQRHAPVTVLAWPVERFSAAPARRTIDVTTNGGCAALRSASPHLAHPGHVALAGVSRVDWHPPCAIVFINLNVKHGTRKRCHYMYNAP